MEITRYQDAAIDSRILRAVEEMGFVQMTPIQEQIGRASVGKECRL